jgi:hypothetical protein
MKITIEPTAEPFELPDGTQGRIWQGQTEKGTRVIAVVVALGCHPEDEAVFDSEVEGDTELEFTGSRMIDLPRSGGCARRSMTAMEMSSAVAAAAGNGRRFG